MKRFEIETRRRLADPTVTVLRNFNMNKVGHLTYLLDIMADCERMEWPDFPLVPDIGIPAQKDIAAIRHRLRQGLRPTASLGEELTLVWKHQANWLAETAG